MSDICKHKWRLEDKTVLGESLSIIFICTQCGEIRPMMIQAGDNISEPLAIQGMASAIYKITDSSKVVFLIGLIVLIILLAFILFVLL